MAESIPQTWANCNLFSIWEYFLPAGVAGVSALLANVTSWPCCSSEKPSPSSDASTWPSVGSFSLKYLSTGALTTAFLILSSSKACSRSWVQFYSETQCVRRHSGSHILDKSFENPLVNPSWLLPWSSCDLLSILSLSLHDQWVQFTNTLKLKLLPTQFNVFHSATV